MFGLLFNFLIKYHQKFIYLFFVLYFCLFLLVLSSFYFPIVSLISNFFGQLSLLLYILTLLPGIATRFKIILLPFTVLRLYRRHIGISMYLFALSHMILSGVLFSQEPFIFFSQIAMIILFILFITSNNFSQTKLNQLWFKIQQLTYFVMFFIFLHVALIDFGILSILLLLTIVLQIFSFVYKRYTTSCPILSPPSISKKSMYQK